MNSNENSGGFFIDGKKRLVLTVDAFSQFQKDELDPDDCTLSDQLHSVTGKAIKSFESHVYSKNKVKWDAEVSETEENKDYDIRIDQIKMLPNSPANIFNTIILAGNNGKVHAKVKNLTNPEDYDYEIWFTIEDPSGNTKSFILDPRLKANTAYSYVNYLIDLINAFPIDAGLKEKLLTVINDFNK
jgi:hypothetical protein